MCDQEVEESDMNESVSRSLSLLSHSLAPFHPWSLVYTQLQCIFLASPRNKEIEKGHDLNCARWHERGVALGCKLEAVQSSPLIYPWVSSHRLPSFSPSLPLVACHFHPRIGGRAMLFSHPLPPPLPPPVMLKVE